MKRLALVLLFVACRKPPEAQKDTVAVVEASAPVVVAPVASSAAVVEPPPAPSEPAACRRAISPGFNLAQVPDATLRALLLDGTPGKKSARDCLGGAVTYENPVPPRVERFDLGDAHMAVWITLAKELGYTSWCPGVAAIVRLDDSEIVAEGVGPEKLDDCDAPATLHLATIDGHRALLFPHVLSTGEEGDFETAWEAWLPDDHGALRSAGDVRSRRSMGNGSMTSGNWFGSMDAEIVDGGSLQVRERWSFSRYLSDGGEEQGAKRTLVRAYSLDGGKLVASPKGDPHQ